MKPTPFPHTDADVRQAYAEHLLHEAINYAVEQAKMAPEAVGKVCVSAINLHAERAKANPQAGTPGGVTGKARPFESALLAQVKEVSNG